VAGTLERRGVEPCGNKRCSPPPEGPVALAEGVELEGAESVAISFPGFFDLLDSVTRR